MIALGMFNVEVSVPGVSAPVLFQMENYISTITEIGIVGVDPQYLGWSMPGTLQAIVDNYHNLVPGAVVTFTAPDLVPA